MIGPLTDHKLQELVLAIQGGDTSAANELFEHGRTFLSDATGEHLESALRAKLSSSDIVQQSLLEAYDQLTSFRGSTVAQFRSWLQTLARHNLIDAHRHFRQAQRRDISREVSLTAAPPLVGPDRTASSHQRAVEADLELWQAVQRLPDADQRIIEMRHRLKLSHAEIAERLEVTEEAVRQKLSRSIRALRTDLARPNGATDG